MWGDWFGEVVAGAAEGAYEYGLGGVLLAAGASSFFLVIDGTMLIDLSICRCCKQYMLSMRRRSYTLIWSRPISCWSVVNSSWSTLGLPTLSRTIPPISKETIRFVKMSSLKSLVACWHFPFRGGFRLGPWIIWVPKPSSCPTECDAWK